jgi:hypothetical protein
MIEVHNKLLFDRAEVDSEDFALAAKLLTVFH